MSISQQLRGYACAGVVCCGVLSACIPIPIPRPSGPIAESRTPMGGQSLSKVVPKETTRTEVLLLLGEPDRRGPNDRWILYTSVAGIGGVGWADVPIVKEVGLDRTYTVRRVTIEFDDLGVVSAVESEVKTCSMWHGCTDPEGCRCAAALVSWPRT
jgi:hypothetical protein